MKECDDARPAAEKRDSGATPAFAANLKFAPLQSAIHQWRGHSVPELDWAEAKS
jgi:hypothetical protein